MCFASSAVAATRPFGMGIPYFAKTIFDWYSWSFMPFPLSGFETQGDYTIGI
jgi:hypothetical protein